MTAPALPDLAISRCASCHGRFLPRPRPCPRCGSSDVQPEAVPPNGEVLAATEILAPATGFDAPHRIALVGLAEDVRVLAEVRGPQLPKVGSVVAVRAEGDRYFV